MGIYMNIEYKNKYLKYKNKYYKFKSKKIQQGGEPLYYITGASIIAILLWFIFKRPEESEQKLIPINNSNGQNRRIENYNDDLLSSDSNISSSIESLSPQDDSFSPRNNTPPSDRPPSDRPSSDRPPLDRPPSNEPEGSLLDYFPSFKRPDLPEVCPEEKVRLRIAEDDNIISDLSRPSSN